MRIRTYLILIWSILWFGVIAPGHERGAVRVPGGETSTSSSHGHACCQRPTPNTTDETPDPAAPEDEDPASACAICYLNGALHTPVPIAIIPAVSRTALAPRPAPPHTPALARRYPPALGRAPPIA